METEKLPPPIEFEKWCAWNAAPCEKSAEAQIERLQEKIQKLEAEAIKDSHRLAEANLRAAQMESQHKQAAEIATAATKELATKSERIQELEAMLESIGAGGVSAQRVTQGKDHIEQPIEMVAAPVVLPEPVAVIENGSLKWKIPTGEYSIDVELIRGLHNLYTEQQVRELLATGGQPQLLARSLAAMKTLELTASPIDDANGDLDARIPSEAWRAFVDVRAALLYEVTQMGAKEAPGLLNALKVALSALEAISEEMTVGERYTNAGQHLVDALPTLRDALAKSLEDPQPQADALDAESDYQRGYRHGYNRRDAEVQGALL